METDPDNVEPRVVPLTEDDQRELDRFKRIINSRNAGLVGEKRYRDEYRHWMVPLMEPGGNDIDEFNFKEERAVDAALAHGTSLIQS